MAMSTDPLSQALSNRRGKGLSPALYSGPTEEISEHDVPNHMDAMNGKGLEARDGVGSGSSEIGYDHGKHGAIDHRVGVDGKASSKGEEHGESYTGKHNLPDLQAHEGGEHTMARNEGEKMSPAASWHSKSHLEEHTSPRGEGGAMGEPVHQSTGMGEGELKSQIREHIIGHQSVSENEQMKDRKPRSLGERVKMMAMKEKNSERK